MVMCLEDDVWVVVGCCNLWEFFFQFVWVFYGNFNVGVFFKFFIYFSEVVVVFVVVNLDNQFIFFNFCEGRGGKYYCGQC